MQKVYLSGASKYQTNNGSAWRKEAADLLKSCGISSFNPNNYYDYKSSKPETVKECRKFFMHNLDISDIVLVNLDLTSLSAGTAFEVGYATNADKPVYGFGGKDAYDWITDSCWKVFPTMYDAIEYLNYYYGE